MGLGVFILPNEIKVKDYFWKKKIEEELDGHMNHSHLTIIHSNINGNKVL